VRELDTQPAIDPMVALRTATGQHHRRLETWVDADAAFASIELYRGLLERLYGFHAPLGPLLEAAGATAFPELLPVTPRAERLAADVARLGGHPSELPCTSSLPDVRSTGAAIGVLYVIEGSSLGGAVLGRRASAELGLGPETGAGFFAAESEAAVSERWQGVIKAIERQADADGISDVIAGAEDTYGQLEAWLCR
jgi:heme oxygenase